ncbi:coiled-coil domain-containing protein 115 [Falco rusticolus]|uniref:coiled-coil domain-containing protein 115 n=1 Tax=Falco peregrinus TaxID=8954 RepID=UPI00188695F0|nr:coiled-coil domain-containing protein 115 [Falco peregrinus]XP_014141944.2 coiled-coil domain-containing protein 115 [Falco cherrug]XP_037267428.1 coiled-coil domain-containing protein 115 [Falco rusticolus]
MAAEPASFRQALSPHPGSASRPSPVLIGRRAAAGGCYWRRPLPGVWPRCGPRMAAAMEGPPGLGAALDAAALELLDALETLQERRQVLTQLLRQGWLSLSQARYSLGCHRVSSLQYGATMVPRVRVLPREGTPHFDEVPGTARDTEDPDPQQEGGDGLRQRRGPPEKRGAPPRAPPDPLAWFGVLVPPSLRQAQGSFVQGVTVAVELAGLQAAVEAAATRYRGLLRRARHPDGDADTTVTPSDETSSTKMACGNETTGDTKTPGDTGTYREPEVTWRDTGDTMTHGNKGTGSDTTSIGDMETPATSPPP